MKLNVQYGCGTEAPEHWINFDISPTLRLKKIPLIGSLIKKVDFPKNVYYGDITNRLPGIKFSTCDLIYCSHVLEHLALNDFNKALNNTYKLLKPGGIFRCVVPDLEMLIEQYIIERKNNNHNASINFIKNSLLGLEERPKGVYENIINIYGNSKHLWMWDKYSLKHELLNCGFKSVRECRFGDSVDPDFKLVENEWRFGNAIAFEAIK